MTEDKSTSSTLLFGLGIALGAFLVYLILKEKNHAQSSYMYYQPYQQHSQMIDNPLVDLNSRMSNIENTLQYLKSSIQQETSQNLNTPVSNIHMPDSINSMLTTYKNNEVWQINRKEDGSIDSLEVKRDVKKGEN